jgi:SAM-dependent methyltransferase
MLDSRDRFSATADLYDEHRPSYPSDLIDWIVATSALVAGAAIADVGCGTGISTRLLASRGFDVVGIDPNEAMLAQARARGGARYARGEAAATGLSTGAVALVTVAQAFHWFDISASLAEFGRVLAPGGWCAVFWNVRALTSGFMAEYDALLRRHSGEYGIVERPEETAARLKMSDRLRDLREADFAYSQRFDEASFLGRVFSSSYVVHGVPDRPAFEGALRELFGRHQQGGALEFQYRSVGLCFRPV